MSKPDRRQLLSALTALIPEIRGRSDLGFTAEAREDALMKAIVRLLEHDDPVGSATESDGPEALARQYALRVVRNLLIDEFRRQQRLTTAPLDVTQFDAPAPSAPQSGARRAERLAERLLAELDPSQEELLRAYLAGRDDFADEVRRQGLRPGTARVRIHRMLSHLRERGRGLVADDGPGDRA